jgi:type II secretion system protein G
MVGLFSNSPRIGSLWLGIGIAFKGQILKEVLMNKKGFTLIELLIVVAIIGIIAAIAIPNLLVALQKGKQKATMGDMKSIGTGLESYVTDWSFVPQTTLAGLNTPTNGVVPFHIKIVPTTDGWGSIYAYAHGTVGASDSDYYSIHSYGRDKTSDNPTGQYFYNCTSISDFDNDIVYSNGTFTYGPRTKK